MVKNTRWKAALLGAIAALGLSVAGCETVEIVAVDVASIEVEPAEFSIAVGEQRKVTAALLDQDGNPITGYTVDWSSNNPDVALVANDGTVRAIGEGVAEITARVNGTDGTAVVTVTPSPSIALAPQAVTFAHTLGGPAPAPRIVRISNAGPGTLDALTASVSYDAGQPSGWLTATLEATAAPTDLRLVVASSTLEAGSYDASVTIASAHAGVAPRVLPVALIVGEPLPVIDVETDAVTFTMVTGGANPPTRAIAVTNVGGGTLTGLGAAVTYTAGQPTGWLSASLSPSTAPATLSLSVSAAGLQPGTYTASVAIVAPGAANSPRNVNVTLTVQAPPLISVSPGTVAFTATAAGADPPAQTVLINNVGGGTLTGLSVAVGYPAGQPSGWLTVELSSTTAPATLTLRASTGALLPGTYTAGVVLAAPGATNSPQTVQVSFDVGVPPASLALSHDAVTFQAIEGGAAPSVSIDVTNAGGGSISGLSATVAYAQGQPTGWLSATLSGTSTPATLTLAATAGSLDPGEYKATVLVAASGVANSPRTVGVTFIVSPPAPLIALSTTTASFQTTAGGANPSPVTISVTNGGQDQLTGLAASIAYADSQPVEWLTASFDKTTAPATLTLAAVTGSLEPGTYDATVAVTAPDAANSPQTVAVTFVVAAAPTTIVLSQTSASFQATAGGANPATVDIGVTNGGGGTLSGLAASITYPEGQAADWLSAAFDQTTAPATLTLAATTGSLEQGTYTATVSVTAPDAENGPQQVDVSFQVAAAPGAPAAPSNLRANVRGDSRIDLRWNDNSNNETHFVVQRSIVASLVWTFSAEVPANTTLYEHRNLLENTRYWFRVLACNANGCSISEVISAVTEDD